MTDRRASRFALELLFLVALAVGLALADLSPLVIGGVMLAGWVIVALLEWAASREQPHYGSGLPPRYYVPQVSMPPPRPLEQVSRYPAAERREEAPTWIAPPELRDEMVGAWPVAPPEEERALEDEPALEEPAAPALALSASVVDHEPAEPGERVDEEPAAAVAGAPEEPEPEQGAVGPAPPAEAEEEPDVAAVDGEELEAAPEAPGTAGTGGRFWTRKRKRREPEAENGEPAGLPEVLAIAEAAALAAEVEAPEAPPPRIIRLRTPRPQRSSAQATADRDAASAGAGSAEHPATPELETGTVDSPAGGGASITRPIPTARHRLDPLAEPESARWPWKRASYDDVVAEVPARPHGVRVLPSRLRTGR